MQVGCWERQHHVIVVRLGTIGRRGRRTEFVVMAHSQLAFAQAVNFSTWCSGLEAWSGETAMARRVVVTRFV